LMRVIFMSTCSAARVVQNSASPMPEALPCVASVRPRTMMHLTLGVSCLAGIPELSKRARQRLKWFDYYKSRGYNARLTCRYFDISPQTFYRWKRRYNPKHIASLEDRSHRPRHLRQPTYSPELVETVLKLREEYPRWGKDKLVVLLRDKGVSCSASMVGRIIRRLKERGVLKEPVPNHISARKRQWQRPYAIRKPRDYGISQVGDLVQLDTLDVRPLPGVSLKHFTAHDVVSRWNIVSVYRRATATTASLFLDTLAERMPFPVKAIQVDGGSEFEASFEEECHKRGIKLFVLPPTLPQAQWWCGASSPNPHRGILRGNGQFLWPS